MADGRNGGTGSGIAGLGLLLGLALVASAWIVSDAFVTAKRQGQDLEVKGFAEKRILSDRADWSGTVTARGDTLERAYTDLERARQVVSALLEREGVPSDEVDRFPATTEVIFARDGRGNFTNRIEGYALRQELRVRSGDIDRVARVARAAADLAQEGLEVFSARPEFFYTKLDELKITMLAEATADARRRAEVLATESGSRVGPLRSARQGVFQITPAWSTEVSDYGHNDTSSREKSIKAVVTIRYAIE